MWRGIHPKAATNNVARNSPQGCAITRLLAIDPIRNELYFIAGSAFNEKLRAHPIVRALSSWKKKMTSGRSRTPAAGACRALRSRHRAVLEFAQFNDRAMPSGWQATWGAIIRQPMGISQMVGV